MTTNKTIRIMESRIYLRALEPDDYITTFEWRKDEEIQNMVGGPKYFVSKEKERQWVLNTITDSNRIVLGICLKNNNKLIGTINIQEIDWINRSARVPIIIGDKAEWGKGFAVEARFMALKFAFEERGMHRIWALVLENNIASLKLHGRCGFVQEGILRDSVFKNGKFHNQLYLGLIREDFDKAYAAYSEKKND